MQSHMSSQLSSRLTSQSGDPFGLYIHVPFCATRCGYCDFNTYTPREAGGANPQGYLDALDVELDMAAQRVGRKADTVFIGGGTPSLLGADGLGRILSTVRTTFGLADDAEVTTESNPESTSPEFFAGLREAGYNRISLGMQSASRDVLQVLERAHTPGRAFAAAREARQAGFEHVNLDMIYATPTETDDDVARTLDLVIEAEVDHVSAYSLIVEDGTAMARKVRRGEIPAPQEDVMATRYEMIARRLAESGMEWYEVSNWARSGGECQHNLIYWRDGDWWGAGPGAHSHLGMQRFSNVKHPNRYSAVLADGELPINQVEDLTPADRHTELLMLGLRLREGIDYAAVGAGAADVVQNFVDRGLLHFPQPDRLALTDAGRLLADGIITDILVAEDDTADVKARS
ncbi:radical SAM family heme chaperone HemW [Corynebacterium propinquum]|uniref:radical SAM family heme chaperone HemW n=1 Tax=Corynebacterium propinquum TaxID=43769 RepID=UPI002543AB06|nr:radical SAM family heme chaperone HemW [Corynebacterium propinquum]MDK4239827.1 radical SAM family heme chaperone HemW [Corynebacterium propinquum]